MDRSNRRRTLGVVAIVVGALASAGTSAVVPTPHLSSAEKGVLTVTADAPVAWVDVRADENPELLAADGQIETGINGTAVDQGVFLIAEEVGAAGSRSAGMGSANREARCYAGEPCGATLRLTAILVDPIGHPSVDVEYTATAEAFFQTNTGPAPSAAAIGVDVNDVQSRSAASVGLATTGPEDIHLGPDLPRAVRTVHVSLPAGPPDDPILFANALVVANQPGMGESFHPDVLVTTLADGAAVDLPWAGASSPLADCVVGAPCETDLELRFSWGGGPPEGSTIEWSLVVWPGVGADAPQPAATIDPPVPADVSWDGPTLTSSASGQANVTRNRGASINLNATLDLSDVPQRAGDVEGLVRLTFRATLPPGTDPAAKVRLSLDGFDVELPGPGETQTAYSRATDISCGGRSTCPAGETFSISLSTASQDTAEATVDWTADVEFLPLVAGEIPDGAKIDLVAPSPPP